MKTYNTSRQGHAWRAVMLLVACMLLWPASSQAKQIQSVSLEKSPRGDVVTIRADESLAYEVFDLQSPPRLVIKFAGAKIKRGVQPLRHDQAGVTSVFPAVDKDGVRLEIGLDKALKYNIEEKGKALVVRFAAAKPAGGKKESAAELHNLDVRDRGSITELVVRGENMDASHDAYVTNKGQTMILDFWGANSKLAKEHYGFATQRVRGVTIGQAEGRVRLVVQLLPGADMKHQIDASKNMLVVRFGNIQPKRRVAAVKVEDVSFQPDDRIAHLVIRTDTTNPVVNISEKDNNVVIDIKKANLSPGQERTQDVRDFPGPVKQVDAYRVENNVRIVARLRDKVSISSFQQGNVMTVTLKPEDLAIARAGVKAKAKFAYTGQKVTFSFKDMDIRNALKMIAEMSKLNIIMSEDVQGKLTMHLVDVPWDQALDLILRTRGLDKEIVGNVVRIAPIEVLRAEYQSKLEAKRGSDQLEPLVTEFITLSYARVEDVKKILDGASANASKGGAAQPAQTGQGATAPTSPETTIGLLSPRGSYLVDERTNTLIIKDTEDSINNIKRLLAVIDRPVQQVLIEARIVEAKDTFSREFGISWGGFYTSGNHRVSNISNTPSQHSTSFAQTSAPPPGGFVVDLPAAVGTGSGGLLGYSFGTLTGSINLDLELSAAEVDDKIKIVSNPRIVTTNLKKAVIDKGTEIPFKTVSQDGTQTEFKKATLGLEVTPQITADNRVILHVIVTKDTPVQKAADSAIDTQRIDTEIFMDNGETIVIGGIYTRDKTTNVAGVPLISKIPILGWLFKKKKTSDIREELLIFLTPKILEVTPAQPKVAQSGK